MNCEDMQRVVFLCEWIPDRSNSTRYQRAQMLASAFRTVIICRGEGVPETLKTRFLRVYRTFGKFDLPQKVILLIYLRLRFKYRIVHTTYTLQSIVAGYFAKRILRYVWVYDIWDHPSLTFSSGRKLKRRLKSFVFYSILENTLKTADVWIIAMNKKILRHLPASREVRIIKVTNGVDLKMLHRIDESYVQPQFLNIGGMRICCAGWVTLKRGVSLLVEYFSKVDRKNRFKVELFGKADTEALEVLDHFWAEIGRGNIEYLGELSAREAILRIRKSQVCLCLIDQSVLNYRYAYPIKIFEYLALGKIIIATRTSATEEIIVDGENGFLINNDVTSLSEALERAKALQLTEELGLMEQRAKKTADMFDWKKINSRLVRKLNEAFESSSCCSC